MTAFTPRLPQASSVSAMTGAGSAITASSSGSGTALISLKPGLSNIFSAPGFTG